MYACCLILSVRIIMCVVDPEYKEMCLVDPEYKELFIVCLSMSVRDWH